MKAIVNLILYFLAGVFLSACGTGQYLGFEKKKIPLKGERVSVLKDITNTKKDNLSESQVELDILVELDDWKQSYNSPSHVGLNYLSNSKFNQFTRIVKGKGQQRDDGKILAQPIISNNKLFFLDAHGNAFSYDLIKKKLDWRKNIIINKDKGHNIGGGLAADESYLFIGSPYAEVFCLETLDIGLILNVLLSSIILSLPI